MAAAVAIIAAIVIALCTWAFFFRGGALRTSDAKYIWVQMLPDEPHLAGGRLVRAIVTEGDRCPKVLEDRKELDMDRRATPVRAAFPILLCERKLAGDSDAWIGSRRLPVRPAEPNDIVVIGDTGCRMVHWEIQACLSGVDWPFAAVASRAAGAVKPSQSFILHVGDFHYRENPCADTNRECGGSPFGDTWETWENEFFKPAVPLLLAAPWVIARGNHENCDRAGAGWLYFFALPGQQKAIERAKATSKATAWTSASRPTSAAASSSSSIPPTRTTSTTLRIAARNSGAGSRRSSSPDPSFGWRCTSPFGSEIPMDRKMSAVRTSRRARTRRPNPPSR